MASSDDTNPPEPRPLSEFLPSAPDHSDPADLPDPATSTEDHDPTSPPLELLTEPELTDPPPSLNRGHLRPVPARTIHYGPAPGRLRSLASTAAAAISQFPVARLSESLSELRARAVVSPATVLIGELLSAEEIALWHGLPRAGKSILLLRACLDLALGDAPVWGEPRFTITKPYRILYFTEEDGPGMVDERISTLLTGRQSQGFSAPPLSEISNLRVIVRKGISFDRPDTQGQSAIIREIVAHAAEVVAFDPLRSFTEKCDQGPSQLAPVTFFLRKILRDTTCRAVIVGHHDVKPARDGVETRGRAHRASGGGIFSIADSPINFERAHDAAPVFCFPTMFKGRAKTPSAFSVKFLSDGPSLTFQITAAGESSPLDLAIIDFVREHPGCTTRTLINSVRGADTHRTTARLPHLVQSGSIVQVSGPRRAFFHYLPDAVPPHHQSEPVLDQLPPQE